MAQDTQTGFATADYDYDLPKELIAQTPLADRAASRLMVVDRHTGDIAHRVFSDITDYLNPGDLLVLNDTKVIPARLHGTKSDTGAAVEVLLLKRLPEREAAGQQEHMSSAEDCGAECRDRDHGVHTTSSCTYECLVRPGKKLRKGAEIVFPSAEDQNPLLEGESAVSDGAERGPGGMSSALRAIIEDVLDDGNRIVRFSWEDAADGRARSFEEILDALGEMPLPPYITQKLKEKDRYNTVYAQIDGSAAAPTAGLHFTDSLLDDIRAKGVRTAYVTLHVGLGTFRPVKTDDVRNHHMHSEWYHVPEETARLINETKARGGRVICVGTTSCRTLESAARSAGITLRQAQGARSLNPYQGARSLSLSKRHEPTGTGTMAQLPMCHCTCPFGTDGNIITPCSGDTDIFIYPGFQFLVTDALITNFHLPQSTLLMLVSAFAGREHILSAYETAVREKYRFFSFGDAMFLH